jgi:phosphatidylinositol-bisphosphatase
MCGTWNVCNKTMDKTSSNELKAWLFPQNVYADIYALGFQEIVDLNAMNVVVDGTKSAEKANHWTIELSELLYKSGIPYTMLLQKHLVGILLVVFVRDNLLPQISDIRGNTVGTGLMGVMGNKGGVTIRLRFFDSTICFVCSHLRHQREEVAGRNMDVKMIMERTQLCPQTDNLYQAQNIMPKSSNNWRTEEFSNNLQIEQHDFIFWLGDLNYRISKSKSVDEVFELVESSSWRSLLLYDQLITEMKKGTIFNDFVEPPINFYPSYKYQPGTPLYEKRPEKKLRAPAWCDRILFKTKQPIEIELYDSPKVLISDHMPVHALFKITGRVVDSMKELEIYKKQLVIIDSMENDLAPKVELRDRMMDLGSLNLEVDSSILLSLRSS